MTVNVFVDLCDYVLLVIVLPAVAARTASTAGAWTLVASDALAVPLVLAITVNISKNGRSK